MIGNRKPFPAPNVLAHVERARTILPQLKGPNSVEIREIVLALLAAFQTQGDFNRSLFDSQGGLPGKHGDTHVGDDPVPVDTAVGLANANTEGDNRSHARSDHTHKRDARVAYNGVDVGTRNRLNFLNVGDAPSDDSGNDEVDVPIASPASVESAMFYAFFVGGA